MPAESGAEGNDAAFEAAATPVPAAAAAPAQPRRLIALRYVLACLLLIVALEALVAAGWQARIHVTGIVDDSARVPLFELVEGRSIAQSLMPTRDNLDAVYVHIATYGRLNTSTLELKLTRFDGPQPLVVARERFNAALLRDYQYLRMDFDAIHDSRGKSFVLEATSPDAQPFNGVTLWSISFDGYPRGALYLDGEERPTDLTFRVRFRPYIRDYLTATPAALLTLDRPGNVAAIVALWLLGLAALAGIVWGVVRLTRREAATRGGDFPLSLMLSGLMLAALALWVLLGRMS